MTFISPKETNDLTYFKDDMLKKATYVDIRKANSEHVTVAFQFTHKVQHLLHHQTYQAEAEAFNDLKTSAQSCKQEIENSICSVLQIKHKQYLEVPWDFSNFRD